MRVAHVNVSDTKGGAARAAFRLHHALGEAGLDSRLVVSEKYSRDQRVLVPQRDLLGYWQRRLRWRHLSLRFWRYLLSRPRGLGPFTDPRARRNRELVGKMPPVDLVNLHWIADYVDLPSFLSSCALPMVWTLHDMNAMTGGCHYTLGCEQFLRGCGACPQLGSTSARDASRHIWEVKEKLYGQTAAGGLHLVTPSAWLASEAHRTPLLSSFPVSVIPNGVDTTRFCPLDREEVRRRLGIPLSKKVVLFAADSLSNRRKGLDLLLDALADSPLDANLLLVSFGAGHTPTGWQVPVLDLGHLDDERLIAQAYSAADLFIIPSMQDNLPNTVLEAMACGTPVVGFAVGGIPEMVRPGTTGLLARPEDVRDLRRGIVTLLGNDKLRSEMSANCRQIAQAEYSLELQASRYMELYGRLLAERETS